MCWWRSWRADNATTHMWHATRWATQGVINCCLVSLLCAYFHSNIYSCKNLWLPHGQLSNTLTKSVQIPQCVSLFISLFLSFVSLLRNLTLSGLGTLPHTRRALVLCPAEICTRLGSVGRWVASAMAETKRWVMCCCPCPGERGVNWLSKASLIRQLSSAVIYALEWKSKSKWNSQIAKATERSISGKTQKVTPLTLYNYFS